MRHNELSRLLKKLARQGTWVLTARQLHVHFPGESQRIFNKSITRHLGTGLLTRVSTGLYLNSLLGPPGSGVFSLVQHLRPWHYNYVSLRSALELHAGAIREGGLQVMTTGRSQVFHTPLGIIEMTHTKRAGPLLSDGVRFDPALGIRVASIDRAKDDFQRVHGRGGAA